MDVIDIDLTDMDLTRLVKTHREKGALSTIALSLVDDPSEYGIVLMNESRGCSNKKAKSALDWRPRYASWRTGFVDGLG